MSSSKTTLRSSTPVPIGSFRNDKDFIKLLPARVTNLLFDVSPNQDINSLHVKITDNKYIESDPNSNLKCLKNIADLNPAAFGRCYRDCLELSEELVEFSEMNPDIFYDQILLNLLKNSYKVCRNFFRLNEDGGNRKCLLQPNTTIAMKSVIEALMKSGKTKFAHLSPTYDPTKILLTKLASCDKTIEPLTEIKPDNYLFQESPEIIIQELENSYANQNFQVLIADYITSQSGRILPILEISNFCKEKGIILVVDGSHAFNFSGETNDYWNLPDYFLISTHKWLGNIKTCNVTLFNGNLPLPDPAGISFGYNILEGSDDTIDDSALQERFSWIGMSNVYIPYITLGKALLLYSEYGGKEVKFASDLLKFSIANVLNTVPELNDKERCINVIKISKNMFLTSDNKMITANKIQNILQNCGIFTSVKMVNLDKTAGCTDANNCTNDNADYFMRISCWSNNKIEDFQILKNIFNRNVSLNNFNIDNLKFDFLRTWELDEALYSRVKAPAFFKRQEQLRHHLIFYFGHTACFYINKLIAFSNNLASQCRINPKFESIFAIGVDEMTWDDILEDNYDWCDLQSDEEMETYLQDVQDYRNKVKQFILGLIDKNAQELNAKKGQTISSLYDSIFWIILMGIEHMKIHIETSSCIIAQVPIENIKSTTNEDHGKWRFTLHKSANQPFSFRDKAKLKNELIGPIGNANKMIVKIGKEQIDQDFFGWDNEFGSETKHLKPFKVSKFLVSNLEFKEFISAGGYKDKKYWSEEGWRYVIDMKVDKPRFWVEKNGSTYLREVFELIKMPWSWPVCCNNLEADAFCRWKSSKLNAAPSSDNRQIRLISQEENLYLRTNTKSETANINLKSYFGSPCPVNENFGIIDVEGEPEHKIYDISGNIWRHSCSVLTVLDGFKAHKVYDDFTLPTIDGHHNHLLGGSWISLGNCANVGGRYGFRRHFYQWAGIRYVESENTFHETVPIIFGEKNNLIGQSITENYSNFNFDKVLPNSSLNKNKSLDITENFQQDLAKAALEFIKNGSKIFVAYGSTGRTSYEILKNSENLKLDHTALTANHLKVLQTLIENGKITWYQQLEGDINQLHEYTSKDYDDIESKNHEISYIQVDYHNMSKLSHLKDYDCIIVDFKYKGVAQKVLENLKKIVKNGGIIVMASIEDIKNVKMNGFRKLASPNRNFTRIFSEHSKKFTYLTSKISIWQKSDIVDGLDHSESILLRQGQQCSGTTSGFGSDDCEFDILDKFQNYTQEYYEEYYVIAGYKMAHFNKKTIHSVQNMPNLLSDHISTLTEQYGVAKDFMLDIGCGPGGVSVNLANSFKQVTAIDISDMMLDVLRQEVKSRGIDNITPLLGDCQEIITKIDRNCDLIVASNCIDRLSNPSEFLKNACRKLNPATTNSKSLLIICTPNTWLEKHTPKCNWIGGVKKDAENYFSRQGLEEILCNDMDLQLVDERVFDFVLPNGDGTFQYLLTDVYCFLKG